jgi:ferrous-iron efflux pump FieF
MTIDHNTISQNHKFALLASMASIATVTLLILIKSYAYWQSSATTVLASLIDSVIDCGISVMTLMAIRYSLKPPDEEHRYGHGKIEGLIALLQAAFITGGGVMLLIESLRRFVQPQEINEHGLAIIVLSISIILSYGLVLVQKHALSRAPSLAVEADRTHYMMDILVNIGVIAVLVALYYGAPYWVDTLVSIVIALYLGFSVREIGMKGLDMLLDRELHPEVRSEIRSHVLDHPEVLGLHDLRTIKSGMRIFISFDVEVYADQSLLEAHEIARSLEITLVEVYPHAEVMIHVDPHDDTDDIRHRIRGVHDV